MPKRKPTQRRSYGYVPEEHASKTPKKRKSPAKKHRTEREPRFTRKDMESKPEEVLMSERKKINFSAILLFPFKILFFLFRLLAIIWRRRPKLEKDLSRSLFKKLFKLGLMGGVLLFVFISLYTVWVSRDLPDPDKLTDRQIAQSTKIYDRTGEHLLYEIFADEKRTLVQFEDLPKELIDAVIATEDTKFYEHRGIRPLSIARSIFNGVTGKSQIGAGASTLTQQLVKNAILTNERRLTRKIKEAVLSIRLEQKYTKDQILQIYFNEIPYGSTNYGVQSAAQSYFGKDVGDLELHEIAVLAGLPKAPSTYLRNKDALKTRRDFVLKRMHDEGKITKEEKEEAQAKPLEMNRVVNNIEAGHFVDDVRKELVDMYGEQMVDTGGLKVITTLDWDKQQIADAVIEEVGLETLEAAGADNTALLAMDPKNGHVLALIGSKDYFDENNGQFNAATLAVRQPGSSFKPIIYTAAFEKGYTPQTVLFDVVTNFAASGRGYTPKNYDLSEHGPVTMKQALQGSLNIPAVKALYLVGENKGVEFSERLGYTSLSDGDFGLSLVLGGGGVRLIEHVAAYSIFANGGKRVKPVQLLRVEDSNGETLYEWEPPKKQEEVLDKDVASTISTVLSDDNARAYAFGTGSILTIPGRPVAAKTGTTNDYIDGWTIGYTPSLVAGVWSGNSDNSPMTRGFGGSKAAGPIWNAFMKRVLDGTPVESFPAAPENDAEKAALRGAEGGAVTLKINRVTGKLATTSTPEQYVVERTYTQPHSILHYVEKDDPRGDVPENPDSDPQYSIWEASIQDWITRKKEEDPDWEISFEEPPADYDDAYSLELIPKLTVVYPATSSTIFSRQIDTDIRVTAPRGVTRVSYKIDGKQVATVREHPFNMNYFAKSLTQGNHVLTVIVQDDVGNTLEEDIPFTYNAAQEAPAGHWQSGNQTVTKTDFPRTYTYTLTKPRQIDVLTFSVEDVNGDITPLGGITDLRAATSTFTWTDAPGKGSYKLQIGVEVNGETEITDTIRVTVQ